MKDRAFSSNLTTYRNMAIAKYLLPLTLLLGAQQVFAADWYEGGTLHKSTASEWSAGSARDKLATSADWTASILGAGRIGQIGGIDAMRPYAKSLVTCIDEATKGQPGHLKTTQIAAACAKLMNW